MRVLHAGYYGLSHFNPVWLFVTPWTAARQAPLFMGFSRQEYWSGLPCPPPGALPTQGLNLSHLCLLHWHVNSLPLSHQGRLKVKVNSLSRIRLFATPWTVAYQAPLSMEFPRQEYWNELPCPPPGALPDPGIEPGSSALQLDSWALSHWWSP